MITRSGCVGAVLVGNMLACASAEDTAAVKFRQDLAVEAVQERALPRAQSVGRKLMIIGTQTDVMVGSVTEDAILRSLHC